MKKHILISCFLLAFPLLANANGISLPTTHLLPPVKHKSKHVFKGRVTPGTIENVDINHGADFNREFEHGLAPKSIKMEELKPDGPTDKTDNKKETLKSDEEIDPGSAPVEHVDAIVTPTERSTKEIEQFNEYVRGMGYTIAIKENNLSLSYVDNTGKDILSFRHADMYGLLACNNYLSLNSNKSLNVQYNITVRGKTKTALKFTIKTQDQLNSKIAGFTLRNNIQQPKWSIDAFGEIK